MANPTLQSHGLFATAELLVFMDRLYVPLKIFINQTKYIRYQKTLIISSNKLSYFASIWFAENTTNTTKSIWNKWASTPRVETYEMPPPQKCIWSRCDLTVWPLTLKTSSAMPTDMGNIAMFHWNLSAGKNRDVASREINVYGRTDRRTDGRTAGRPKKNIMLLAACCGLHKIQNTHIKMYSKYKIQNAFKYLKYAFEILV